MKVKILQYIPRDDKPTISSLEEKINKFIEDKKVVDIKYRWLDDTACGEKVFIMYEDEIFQNDKGFSTALEAGDIIGDSIGQGLVIKDESRYAVLDVTSNEIITPWYDSTEKLKKCFNYNLRILKRADFHDMEKD